MMHGFDYFVFDGVSSADFGMYTFASRFLTAPTADMQEIVVPGRNGVLHQYNDRFGNATVRYSVVSHDSGHFKDVPQKFTDLLGFLLSRRGYHRLEDTFRPDEYRMAVYKGGDGLKTLAHDEAGGMVLTFTARPERWLKSGETAIQCASGSVLFNPTFFTAKPLIRAYGTGTVSVSGSDGAVSVKINVADAYTDIDCELQEAFKGSVNCNGNIELPQGSFPVLAAGESTITFSGLGKVEITPRWYKI